MATATETTTYTPEQLEGLERIVTQNHACQWTPLPCDSAAAEAGLAVEDVTFDVSWNAGGNARRFTVTPLGRMVWDAIAQQREVAYRSSTDYQKKLERAKAQFGESPLTDCPKCEAREMVSGGKCLYCKAEF